jgi:general secretion pathway protein C
MSCRARLSHLGKQSFLLIFFCHTGSFEVRHGGCSRSETNMAPERAQRLVRVSATVVTLLLSAMLTARGATQLLAAAVLPVGIEASGGKKPVRPRASANEPPKQTPLELGTSVLQRNMFDSQTGAMEWDLPVAQVTPVEGEGEAGPSDELSGEPAPCGGNLRLVATTVVPRKPELSFASISTGVEGKSMLYRKGMTVDGHELVGIREQRVFLRPSGRPLCQAAMFSPPPAAAPVAVAAPPPGPAGEEKPPPAPKSAISEEELNAGITQVSDTQYSVARGLLDKVLSAQAELMRAARVIPYEENGRVVGVKVYGIRRAALLGKLGIQNGDVLRTINGFDLSSPDTALEAYTKLREMDHFSIAMVRRGQPRTMEYNVK